MYDPFYSSYYYYSPFAYRYSLGIELLPVPLRPFLRVRELLQQLLLQQSRQHLLRNGQFRFRRYGPARLCPIIAAETASWSRVAATRESGRPDRARVAETRHLRSDQPPRAEACDRWAAARIHRTRAHLHPHPRDPRVDRHQAEATREAEIRVAAAVDGRRSRGS